MRYTKYNYNNNRNRKRGRGPKNNFFLIGLLICIPLAIIIGMVFGPMIFKGKENGEEKPPIADTKEPTKKEPAQDKVETPKPESEPAPVEKAETEDFFFIQCGVYGNEENAKKVFDKIPGNYNKFITKENEKFKVIAGIFNDEDSKNKSKQLEDAEIVNVRIKAKVPKADSNSIKIGKISKSYLEILKKLQNDEVKSVNTEEFKKWTAELKSEKDKTAENEEVKNLKEHISKLPKELEKKDSQKSTKFLYDMLNKYRS